MDPNALNLAITPEAAAVRSNIVNHLKRRYVLDRTEGNAGHNPEESLGSGKRTQIRFRPIVMKKRNGSIAKSQRKKMHALTNKGTEKAIGDTPHDGDESSTPLAGGLDKAIRGRFRKNPGELMKSSRVNPGSMQIAHQKGLRARSEDSFKDKTKQKKRKKLDVSF